MYSINILILFFNLNHLFFFNNMQRLFQRRTQGNSILGQLTLLYADRGRSRTESFQELFSGNWSSFWSGSVILKCFYIISISNSNLDLGLIIMKKIIALTALCGRHGFVDHYKKPTGFSKKLSLTDVVIIQCKVIFHVHITPCIHNKVRELNKIQFSSWGQMWFVGNTKKQSWGYFAD